MMTKAEAKHMVRVYWLSLPKYENKSPLTPMEFYLDIQKNRPDLLDYARRKDADPYQDIKAWVWEYVQSDR